ncbi:Uncharacterized protein BP5553_09354 [Venustampulla echinocandica]|uniref:Sequence orphan n=1 Tax=Venustampulla echinocandica TaxID=2656787 RepID=A0A370TCI4_9HELO|nr:Uncharacterized protein BP5553_09354 [Venustampulla echinocandica]RDL31952.1 Uncharacterized protein BP5553_09354 [Venustampulla echinocandica]
MTSQFPGLESPQPKMGLEPKKKAGSSKAAGSREGPKVWNTKNLGLRLASDCVSGVFAASLVAPLIAIIDQGIMQNASGQSTLKESVKTSLTSLVLRPHTILFSKPFALICMVYGGTFVTANTLDTITSTVKNKPYTHVTADTMKFAASSTANIGLTLIKDQAFVRLFGSGGPPRPVSLPSYALFTIRDCLTIFASFNVPPLLGPVISRNMSTELEKRMSGQTVAQFVAPAAVQIVSTPMHLLGLDLYNRGCSGITWADRWAIVKKNWAVSSAARICRIVPAFGFGGVVNAKVRYGLLSRLD